MPFSPFLFLFYGKSPLIILVFFAVSANIPSACEVLICLVDVLFFRFARDYLALHKCLPALRLGFLRSLALSLEGHL